MWQVHQAQARDVRGEVDLPTEWERADPRTVEPSADSLGVDAGAPTGQEVAAPDETPSGDLEADAAAEAEVRPATAPEEAEAAKTTSQPPSLPMAAPIIEIGDTQSVQRRPREIECECGRVHDGGAAPPLLSIGEKKLTLEFKVGGPKVMERMVDSLKVKATISGTNKCAQKDQTIVVSFNVSDGAGGAAPARPVCECVSEATSFASPKRAARDADSCSCSLASEKMTYDSDSIAKSLECVCWDAPKTDGDVCSCGPTTQDKQTGGATATKKCGPECGGITNKARVTSALCQALRERLTERPQTTQKVCRCGRTHSVACVAKVREEIGDGCPCKRRIESKGTSAPRMCETSVQRVMECLKQQSFKDPEQLDRHLKGLQPLLRRLEGVSLQSFRCSPTSHSRCVCVSSVQVIYKKSDETRSPGPPVVLPVNETCICDLCHGGDATPLYQEEDEYREAYFDVGEEGRAPAKGVSSLPEVVNETDGCPRRTELPWLTMTLPPPGSIKIRRQPKKPCACKKKERAATVDRIVGCCVCPEEGKVRPEEVPCACTVTKRPDESCYCRTLESPTLPCTCDCPPSKPAVSEQYSAPKVPPEAPTQTTQPSGHDVTCPCYRPCPELKPTKLLYDDLNYATNEEYMDPLYKMFPDESESPCGATTEINWGDYVLPTNVRLMTREKKRGKKKQAGGTTTVASQTSRTTDQSRRSTRAPSSSSPAKTPVPIQDSSTSRQTQADSMVQLELNFSGYTEIISTLMPVEDGAVEQHTVSEFSAITDITRTIRRMDSNRVRTVLADGEAPSAYGIVPTVGSQPFGIAGDATRGDFLTFVLPPPAPQVAPSPEMPERVSDLIKLISLEPPAVGGASQKPSTLSAGPRRPRSPARTRPTTAPLPADLVIITSVDTEPVGLGEKSPAAKKRSASSGGSKRTREVGINCGKPACEGTRKPRGPETASVSFTASPCKSPLQEAESECSLDRVASPILAAIRTVEREMKPLHDTLNELRAKIQTMDIPELENWSQRASCTSCQKKAPYGGGPQQVNLFVQDVPGPFRREPPPKRCVCLESVDDDYVPTGMRDVVDETMGLDRMVKQSVKPAPIKKSRDDLKDYMRAVERTMALDRMIRREFKARATQSESSINRTYKKQSPKQRTSGTNKCASSELNAKKNRQPYPAEWTYYPYMIDWFYQQHMYNSYLYSYYYYPEYIFGFSRTNTVVCRETKGRSSASSSESTSRSYSSVCSSERSSYPSSRFTGSTDDDEDPDFTRVFKAGESVVASVSKEERRELKITLKATRSGRTTSGGEEVYSSSS